MTRIFSGILRRAKVEALGVAMPGARLPERVRQIVDGSVAARISRVRMAVLAAACVAICGAFAAGDVARAQQSGGQASTAAVPGERPKFEVASIKSCDGSFSGRGGPSSPGPGRLREECGTVASFIQQAYVLFTDSDGYVSSSVEGGPGWINSDRYEIDAETQGDPSRKTMNGPMLQSLLEDRFQLKIHRETRQIPVYELTIAKGGPKMQPVTDGSCILPGTQAASDAITKMGRGAMQNLSALNLCDTVRFGLKAGAGDWTAEVHAATVDEFCDTFTNAFNRHGVLGRPVLNKTGLSGMFNFQMEYALDETTANSFGPAPPPEPSEPSTAPSIFTAFEEQLGLKLESSKGPGTFLVIDHVDRPTPN